MSLEEKYINLIEAFVSQNFDSAARERFSMLFDLVVETNSRINITSLLSPIDVTLKHIADSLTLFLSEDFCNKITDGHQACDIGCGGGFPGLPIACAEPRMNLTMIDSTEKKIVALKENVLKLGLTSVFPLWGRGEELASPKGGQREKFDLCVSRAVASLPVLCELCLPFVKVGGVFIALKGQKTEEELSESIKAIPMLGGKLKEVVNLDLSDKVPDISSFTEEEQKKILEFAGAKRSLIVIEKKKATQPIYPRKWSQMVKKPL